MRFLIFNIIFFLNITFLYSQNTDIQKNDIFADLKKNDPNSGKIKIYQEERIGLLVNKHINVSQKQNGFMGYRVQVFFGSGGEAKKKALEIKSKISTAYPDIEAHIIYETPNFKLRLGDFRTKNEAYKFKKQLSEEYPSAFIVEDIIDLPKLN